MGVCVLSGCEEGYVKAWLHEVWLPALTLRPLLSSCFLPFPWLLCRLISAPGGFAGPRQWLPWLLPRNSLDVPLMPQALALSCSGAQGPPLKRSWLCSLKTGEIFTIDAEVGRFCYDA